MASKNVRSGWMLLMVAAMTFGANAVFADEYPEKLEGDIGLGAYWTRGIIKGRKDQLSILPYADFNDGRLFARVDTFGVKMEPMGYGHLELIGRFSQDGYRTDIPSLKGLNERKTSLPLGIGTLQVTPIGGFYINAFHDVNESKGNVLEVIYGGALEVADVTFYPLLGMEYQSGAYVRYYYGISGAEAAASAYPAYQPAGAYNAFAGLIADIRLSDRYHLNCYLRRKHLGDAIRSSPIVDRGYLDTAYIALSYRY